MTSQLAAEVFVVIIAALGLGVIGLVFATTRTPGVDYLTLEEALEELEPFIGRTFDVSLDRTDKESFEAFLVHTLATLTSTSDQGSFALITLGPDSSTTVYVWREHVRKIQCIRGSGVVQFNFVDNDVTLNLSLQP